MLGVVSRDTRLKGKTHVVKFPEDSDLGRDTFARAIGVLDLLDNHRAASTTLISKADSTCATSVGDWVQDVAKVFARGDQWRWRHEHCGAQYSSCSY